MYVINKTETELVYRTNDHKIILFPGTIIEIEEGLVTEKELKDCYGAYINILTEEEVNTIKKERESVKDSTDFVNHEWQIKEMKAEAYLKDLEADDDSDKHYKLGLMKQLIDEATAEGRTYDSVSLLKDIEEAFIKFPPVKVNNGEKDETNTETGTTSEGSDNSSDKVTEGSNEIKQDLKPEGLDSDETTEGISVESIKAIAKAGKETKAKAAAKAKTTSKSKAKKDNK